MASKRDLHLIRLACRRRWLTAEQGEDCLFLKRKLGGKLTLEQILRQRRYLTDEEIEALVRVADGVPRRPRALSNLRPPPSVALQAPAERPDVLAEPPLSAPVRPSPSDDPTLFGPPAGAAAERAPVVPLEDLVPREDDWDAGAANADETVIASIDELGVRRPSPATQDPTPFALSRPPRGGDSSAASAPPARGADRGDAFDPALVPTIQAPAVGPGGPRPPSLGREDSQVSVRPALSAASPPRGGSAAAGDAAPPELEDAPGPFGAYRVHHLVARGQRSAVYRATHVETQRDVALKVLLAPGRAAASFISERGADLVAAAQIDHPRVVRVLDVGNVADRYYVALEHAPGWALEDKLTAEEPMTLPEALTVATDVSRALAAAAAQGVVHADVRPDHVIIDDQGRARLTGFGFYNVFQGRRGTPGFMAPEVAAGAAPTPRSDQFGLGAMLFRLAVGRPAYQAINQAERLRLSQEVEAPDPRLYRADLPPSVAQLILRLLARDPDARFPTFEEAGAALEQERAALSELAAAAAPSLPFGPLAAQAVVYGLVVALAALGVPLALDLAGWTSLREGRLARPVALVAAAALSVATVTHLVLALIRRGELPLPTSSAWLVRAQELAGLLGAGLLVAGFAVAPPAALNLVLASGGGVLLASSVFGRLLREAVARSRGDGGVGRVLAVLGDPHLVRWRLWHVPGLTSVAAVAAARWMALAYFAAS